MIVISCYLKKERAIKTSFSILEEVLSICFEFYDLIYWRGCKQSDLRSGSGIHCVERVFGGSIPGNPRGFPVPAWTGQGRGQVYKTIRDGAGTGSTRSLRFFEGKPPKNPENWGGDGDFIISWGFLVYFWGIPENPRPSVATQSIEKGQMFPKRYSTTLQLKGLQSYRSSKLSKTLCSFAAFNFS